MCTRMYLMPGLAIGSSRVPATLPARRGAARGLKMIDRVKLRIFSALSDKADLRGMHITAPGVTLPVIAPLIAATLYFRPVIDLGSAWKFQLNIYS